MDINTKSRQRSANSNSLYFEPRRKQSLRKHFRCAMASEMPELFHVVLIGHSIVLARESTFLSRQYGINISCTHCSELSADTCKDVSRVYACVPITRWCGVDRVAHTRASTWFWARSSSNQCQVRRGVTAPRPVSTSHLTSGTQCTAIRWFAPPTSCTTGLSVTVSRGGDYVYVWKHSAPNHLRMQRETSMRPNMHAI